MSSERLQKILAQAGIASRRKAEELIELGLVTVNGKVAKVGDKASLATDHIKIDGKLLRKVEDHIYLTFYKPRAVISQMGDPEGRPSILDYLTKLKFRVFPIGRLDFNSEGILLLTNDGELAEKIQKANQFPRVYRVKVKGHITSEMIDRLSRGMKLNNKFVKPHFVRMTEEYDKKSQIEVVFLNGTNLDVKSYFEQKGFLVDKLVRMSYGHITLHGLKPGQYKIVNRSKFEALITQPELGVKSIEKDVEKDPGVLPRDKRFREVDEFGNVIRTPRGPSPIKPLASADQADSKKSPLVRSRSKYTDSVIMPKSSSQPSGRTGGKAGNRGSMKPRGAGGSSKKRDSGVIAVLRKKD